MRGPALAAAMLGLATQAPAQTYEPDGGIWKYQVPKEGIRGEFGNEDVMGVVAGKHIRTDCSVNVVKNGRIYCFTAAASQTIFNYAPNTNLAKAYKAWETIKSGRNAGAPSQ